MSIDWQSPLRRIKLVNIIIPTYKARETLPNALDSLVAQTKKMFMVTIVQDHDDEDYSDIIKEYYRRGLKIWLIQTPENVGPGRARQYGIDKTNMCDYCMFLDADDMLLPRAVEVLYHEAKLQDADLISSSFMVEQLHKPALFMDVENTPVTWTHGKIYKLDYLRKNNIRFLDELRLNEDSYFNLVAVNSTDKKFKVKEITYLWRDNPKSLTRDRTSSTFFERSWEQYIYSQVHGLIDIERITGKVGPNLVAATLNNMYNHIMEAIYRKKPLEKAKEMCLQLKHFKSLEEAMNVKDFWQTIHSIVKGTILKDNTLIFCKMRFCDWLNEFILEKEPNQ